MKRSLLHIGLLLGLVAATGCVNQAGTDDPYRIFTVTDSKLQQARQSGQPYVKGPRGNLQTIEPVDYETSQFGLVRLASGYVSDGSSRPFDIDPASTRAALLHDALYRGAPQLQFPGGFRGEWTKEQADSAYCEQLQKLGAPPNLAKSNCLGVRLLKGNLSVWGFHKARREAYWSAHR